MKKQVGFTLIELIIVIVILGILAAYAVPKYMSVDKEARIAVVKGMKATMLAASDLTAAVASVKGTGTEGGCAKSVNTGRGIVCIGTSNYPMPAGDGIGAAIADSTGFTCTAAGNNYTCTKDGAPTAANCVAVYSYDSTSATTYPAVTSTDTGC